MTYRIWSVRFETKSGMYHPIRLAWKSADMTLKEARKEARAYLKDNSHWLSKVDEIREVKPK